MSRRRHRAYDLPAGFRRATRIEAVAHYTALREHLKRSVRRVMEIKPEHVHFAAALLMTVGCEAVGTFLSGLDGQKREAHEVFVEDLVLPHGTLNASMGRDLFHSIRHGIAHRFWPKPIVLRDSGRSVMVTLNWGTRPRHLGLLFDRRGVVVNLPTMQADFETMLNKYRDILQANFSRSALTDRWWTEAYHPATKESERGWQVFLDQV